MRVERDIICVNFHLVVDTPQECQFLLQGLLLVLGCDSLQCFVVQILNNHVQKLYLKYEKYINELKIRAKKRAKIIRK